MRKFLVIGYEAVKEEMLLHEKNFERCFSLVDKSRKQKAGRFLREDGKINPLSI